MPEASVSFAGNITNDPKVHSTEGGDRPCDVPGGRLWSAGAGAVVLHRDCVALPGRARRPIAEQEQPGRGRRPAPAAGMDRWSQDRWPARPAMRRCGTWTKHAVAFRSVVSVLVGVRSLG
jgi:hypothetical protein